MSDAPDTSTTVEEAPAEQDALEAWTAALAESVGALGYVVEFDTPRISVDAERCVETILAA